MSRSVAFIFGTRPEAIKLFPVIYELQRHNNFCVSVWVTGQHRQMLDQVLNVAQIVPEVDLNVMVANQSLDALTARLITGVGQALDQHRPDCVVVQGDTTSAMAASLAAFYRKIPVAHVEAGLRTNNRYSPWPEEINRRIISSIAEFHFAPTKRAVNNLRAEGIVRHVFLTGNTGIDALLLTHARLRNFAAQTAIIDELTESHRGGRIILVTAHRRESFGGGLERIAQAILSLAKRDDISFFFPVHRNPAVSTVFLSRLEQCNRVVLSEPLDYVPFVYLMSISTIILTDSGGIQEEAPSLGKPVLVMRDTTERMEGVEAGTAKLVGTETIRIVKETERLLDDAAEYGAMSKAVNPYGDGQASRRIGETLDAFL